MCEPYSAIGDPNSMLALCGIDYDFEFDDSMTIDDSFAEIFNAFPHDDFLCEEQHTEGWALEPLPLTNVPVSPLFSSCSEMSSFVSSFSSRTDESSRPTTPVLEPQTHSESDEVNSQYTDIKPIAHTEESTSPWETSPPSLFVPQDDSKDSDYPGLIGSAPKVDYSYIKQEIDGDESLLRTASEFPSIGSPLDPEYPKPPNPTTLPSDDFVKEELPLTPMIRGGYVTKDDDSYLPSTPLSRSIEALLETSKSYPALFEADNVKSDPSDSGITLDAKAPTPRFVRTPEAQDRMLLQLINEPASPPPRLPGRRRAARGGTRRIEMSVKGEDDDGEDEVGDWNEVVEPETASSRRRKHSERIAQFRPRKLRKLNDNKKVVGHAKATNSRPTAAIKKSGPWTFTVLCEEDRSIARYNAAHFPPDECERCMLVGFPRKSDMKRHLDSQHPLATDERPFCPKCRLRVCRKDALTRHERRCKGKPRKRRLTQLEMREKRKSDIKLEPDTSASSSRAILPLPRRSTRRHVLTHSPTRHDY